MFIKVASVFSMKYDFIQGTVPEISSKERKKKKHDISGKESQ